MSQDYNEAIQNPTHCFTDPELQQGEAVTNALGLPVPCSAGRSSELRTTLRRHCVRRTSWDTGLPRWQLQYRYCNCPGQARGQPQRRLNLRRDRPDCRRGEEIRWSFDEAGGKDQFRFREGRKGRPAGGSLASGIRPSERDSAGQMGRSVARLAGAKSAHQRPCSSGST